VLPSKKNDLNAQPNIHWYSALQLALSLLAIFFLWSAAFLLVLLGLSSLLFSASGGMDAVSALMLAGVTAFGGLLLLPSAWYALMRLMGREYHGSRLTLRWFRPSLLILAFPLLLIIGYGAVQAPAITWLVLPPVHVLAVSLPVLWVVYLGVRNLPLGSPQRRWGVFGSGLALGPTLTLVAEGMVGLALIILAAIVLASQPGLIDELSSLAEGLSDLDIAPEQAFETLSPYILRPGVILSIFLFTSLIVPMLEEAIKPVGVWLLAGRKMTPAAGFAAGVLSGAGFALFESLVMINGADMWVTLVVARIGTAFVHILTSGLTGWALALAWGRRRYLRLILTYLGAVLIHGLWNSISIMTSFSVLGAIEGLEVPTMLTTLGNLAPVGLSILAGCALAALLWINHKLARRIWEPVLPETNVGSSPQIDSNGDVDVADKPVGDTPENRSESVL